MKEEDPKMSLIGKKVGDFKVQAYINGEFKEVTLEDVRGAGAYFSSILRILLLFAPQSWKIWQINMKISRKSAAIFILFPVIPTMFTKHGMIRQNASKKSSILCLPILPAN